MVAHNTLSASDYALIDQDTLAPRPNYWSAVLWRKLMDATVLDAGSPGSASVHLYAHCLRGVSGGVAVTCHQHGCRGGPRIGIPFQADRYTLTAKDPMDNRVDLNGCATHADGKRRRAGDRGSPAARRRPGPASGEPLFLRDPAGQQPGLRVRQVTRERRLP